MKELAVALEKSEAWIKEYEETTPGNELTEALAEGYMEVAHLTARDINAGEFESLDHLDRHLRNVSASIRLLNPFGGDERGRAFQRGVVNACNAIRKMIAKRQVSKAVQN